MCSSSLKDGAMDNRAAYTKGQLLGVHVVSEYVFCPRAMLATHAHTCEDHGEEL